MQQKLQLYINDQLADLLDSDTEPVQMTFQANNLGNLASIEANYTKQFELPLTKRNRIILGFPDDMLTVTQAPYSFYSSKVVYAGVELIPVGRLYLTKIMNKTADVTIISGNNDLLDICGGQLYDMGDSTSQWSNFGKSKVFDIYNNFTDNKLNAIFDVDHMADSQVNTDGWLFPIVDYGSVPATFPYTGFINVRNQRPAFFIHTALELLMKYAGYSIDTDKSCLYNNPIYNNLYMKMLVQFNNSDFEHGTDYQNTPDNLSMVNNIAGTQQFVSPGGPSSGRINFNQETYVAAKAVDGTVYVQFDLYLYGIATGSKPTQIIISITVQNADGSGATNIGSVSYDLSNSGHRISGDGGSIITDETFLNCKLSADVELAQGMIISITYQTVNSQNTFWKIFAGASFTFQSSERLVLWGQPFQVERIFPNMSQIDLIKFVLQVFGLTLVANPNAKTVTFISFKQIVANIPNSRDWSLKCIDAGKQTEYNLGNYAQENWLRYAQDDSIPLNNMPKYFADDHIDIDDSTLNPTQPVQDLFSFIFAPSLNRKYLNGTIAQMCGPNNTDAFAVGSAPRILIDQKYDLRTIKNVDGSAVSITFSDADSPFQTYTRTVNGIISVPYFFKPDAPDLGGAANQLAWKDMGGLPGLRTTYYPEFEHILDETKKVTRYFNLTPLDILDFDFSIPVYLRQDNAYFYVNKIDSWVVGRPVKVELIRL